MQKLRCIHPTNPALDTYLHIPEHSIIMMRETTTEDRKQRKELRTQIYTVFGVMWVAETAEEIRQGFYLPTDLDV